MFFSLLMRHCSSKSIQVLNKRTIITNINVKGALKELEHRNLGWKVLILKYDLGKSLSKEMWCKIADTKKIYD